MNRSVGDVNIGPTSSVIPPFDAALAFVRLASCDPTLLIPGRLGRADICNAITNPALRGCSSFQPRGSASLIAGGIVPAQEYLRILLITKVASFTWVVNMLFIGYIL